MLLVKPSLRKENSTIRMLDSAASFEAFLFCLKIFRRTNTKETGDGDVEENVSSSCAKSMNN